MKVQLLTINLLVLLLVGCIPGHYIGGEAEQIVTVDIAGLDGGDVSGAKVTFTRDHRAVWTYADLPNDDASYLERSVEGEGLADEAGQVALTFPTVTVCSFSFPINVFPCGDPLEDRVTGETYLFGVELDGETEYFSMPVVPGEVLEGELFSLTIDSVGDATPVESNESINEESS